MLSKFCVVLFIFLAAYCDAVSRRIRKDGGADWKAMRAWLTAGDAFVHEGIEGGRSMPHGGFDIRSVVATQDFPDVVTLLTVPRKQAMELRNHPEFQNAPLQDLPGCSGLVSYDSWLDWVKLAAVIATEVQKGSQSKYSTYLQQLPTLADYRSFHPRFMEANLQKEFYAFPIVGEAKSQQERDAKTKTCFEEWRQMPGSVVATITWEEELFGLAQIQNRMISNWGRHFMIPGMDLVNTDPRRVNTQWQYVSLGGDQGDVFALSGYAIEPGQEIFVDYCSDCDNQAMLLTWGIFLEDNPNDVDSSSVNCAAEVGNENVTSTASRPITLREASEAILDMKGLDKARESGWKAPRCDPKKLVSEQGPLQCSMARLAFETCAHQWNPGFKQSKAFSLPNPWNWANNTTHKLRDASRRTTQMRTIQMGNNSIAPAKRNIGRQQKAQVQRFLEGSRIHQ